MSFIVETVSPIDSEWQDRDAKIKRVVNRKDDTSCVVSRKRVHRWIIVRWEDAIRIVKQLREIPEVKATIREK